MSKTKTYSESEIRKFREAKTILFRAAQQVAKLGLPFKQTVDEFEFQLSTMEPYNKPSESHDPMWEAVS